MYLEVMLVSRIWHFRIPYKLLSKFIIDMININIINKLAKLTVLPYFICLFNDVTSSAYS